MSELQSSQKLRGVLLVSSGVLIISFDAAPFLPTRFFPSRPVVFGQMELRSEQVRFRKRAWLYEILPMDPGTLGGRRSCSEDQGLLCGLAVIWWNWWFGQQRPRTIHRTGRGERPQAAPIRQYLHPITEHRAV